MLTSTSFNDYIRSVDAAAASSIRFLLLTMPDEVQHLPNIHSNTASAAGQQSA